MKKIFNVVILICIVVAAYYGLEVVRKQKVEEEKPEIIRPVKTVTLTNSGKGGTWSYYGILQGGRRVDLSFRVSGPIKNILVDKGASVKKNEVLATLDPRDFQTQLKQAQSAQSQAEAQYKNAQADFTRYENLYKQKVIAKAQYDTYKTQVDVTKSAVNSAEANLKSARDALKDTELRAPFNGVITQRTIENYQDVTAKQTIFVIQDLSALEIVFNIPDNDIILAPLPELKSITDLQKYEGKLYTISARFEAIPDKSFPLKLKEVSPQATTSNTYPVTAVMDRQSDVRILPGMAATVEAVLDSSGHDEADEDKYLVPTTAILSEAGNNYVWRYDNGTVTRIPVTTGLIQNNAYIQIEGPLLRNEDTIVTAGVNFLREGQHVRLLEE